MVFLNKLTKRLQQKGSHLIMSSEDFTVTLGSVDQNGVDFFSLLEQRLQG
jgi:ABC-type cobalamin transport system ATPase subunit